MHSVLCRWLVLVWLALCLAGCGSTQKKIATPVASQGNWRAVSDASRLQGYPYRYGGESPDQGFDCSGLVQYIYAKQGVRLPRNTLDMAQALPAVSPTQRLPGDLLFFATEDKPFSHVGLYLGQDVFVHAPSNGQQVMRSSLANVYWRERLTGVRRPTAP